MNKFETLYSMLYAFHNSPIPKYLNSLIFKITFLSFTPQIKYKIVFYGKGIDPCLSSKYLIIKDFLLISLLAQLLRKAQRWFCLPLKFSMIDSGNGNGMVFGQGGYWFDCGYHGTDKKYHMLGYI
jgi:hypothetical protein